MEALEAAMRMAMHQVGTVALSQLLRCDPPRRDQRELACSCGQIAHYREMRPRHLLTVLGEVELLRPYYLCSHCHQGQFPFDAELDIEKLGLSPGVRRMLAVVGQSTPFDQGREQIKLLAGLEVTTKAVERTAEAIGEDIAEQEREQIQQALNWPAFSTQAMIQGRNNGFCVTSPSWMRARSKSWLTIYARCRTLRRSYWKPFVAPPIISRKTPNACAIQNSVASISSLARGSLRQGAKPSLAAASNSPVCSWTVRGANAIIALRCCQLNGRFEDYWEARRA
jgi:hypothetical protein